MAYPVTNMTAQVRKERLIIAEWEKNHFFRDYVSTHKDTNEPCYMNPCTEGLKLQEIGINIIEPNNGE